MPERRAIFNSIKAATVALAIMADKGDGKCPFVIIGSGFCVDSLGVIVTCEHVLSAFMAKPLIEQIGDLEKVDSKEGIRGGWIRHRHIPFVIFYRTDFEHDQLLAVPTQATICMAKTDFDLAGIRVVPHAAFPTGFPFIEIEDSQNVCEGDEIATCGFPLGNYLNEQIGTATSSFTTGIVSSIIPAPNTPQKYLKGFQLNLTAAPGNSGGPVFSLKTGKVFGVLQSAIADQGGVVVPNITKAEPVYPVFKHDFLSQIKRAQIPKPDTDAGSFMKQFKKD